MKASMSLMETIEYPDPGQWASLCRRPDASKELLPGVLDILENVRSEGDRAVLKYAQVFDGVQLKSLRYNVSASHPQIRPDLAAAIRTAAANIEKFHRAQVETGRVIETTPGVQCWRKSIPIDAVGLYIPGGSAPLFSTLLMLGIPAKLAGCQEIVICTPPSKDGGPDPVIAYTSALLGIRQIFLAGGAQGIGAMAYGTETIPKVNKIFGPGNQYVTIAKQCVQQQGVAIDLPAGPSEVLVIADETGIPDYIAADLLSQAEHGTDSQVILVCTSQALADSVMEAISMQLKTLPRRGIAETALRNSKVILVRDLEEAMAFSNHYAPEHLILATTAYETLIHRVRNAGSVFLGNYSCESAGDYASGTNHTLPTNGYARGHSGVSLDSFVKKVTFQHLSPAGLRRLGPTIEIMADAEHLTAHQRAVSIRLATIDGLPDDNKHHPPDPLELARENVKHLTPYASARDDFHGAGKVWLDANEHPEDTGVNRYPDPHQVVLKSEIGRIKGIPPGRIFLGNGSDEAIDLIVRVFCRPGQDSIAILTPTYGMYAVTAAVNDLGIEQIPLEPGTFQLTPDALTQISESDARVLFLCSPNNPTGNLLRQEDLHRILDCFHGVVVLDEAYIDFAPERSMLPQLSGYRHLIILQTLSKAWGLAGIRLGMAFASESIIGLINKIKPPYNINTLTQEKALEILRSAQISATRATLNAERERLCTALAQFPFVSRIYPSDANFLLIMCTDVEAIYNYLAAQGIIVRNRSSAVPGCLRITIGTAAQNDVLIHALENFTA